MQIFCSFSEFLWGRFDDTWTVNEFVLSLNFYEWIETVFSGMVRSVWILLKSLKQNLTSQFNLKFIIGCEWTLFKTWHESQKETLAKWKMKKRKSHTFHFDLQKIQYNNTQMKHANTILVFCWGSFAPISISRKYQYQKYMWKGLLRKQQPIKCFFEL